MFKNFMIVAAGVFLGMCVTFGALYGSGYLSGNKVIFYSRGVPIPISFPIGKTPTIANYSPNCSLTINPKTAEIEVQDSVDGIQL